MSVGISTNETSISNIELQSNKDTTNGYVGLTALKINFKNVLNTFTSYFTNSNTTSRIYTFQDKDQTIAGLDDILPTTLTGLSKSAGTLSITDTILQGFNKIAGLIDNDTWVSYTPSLTGITLGNGTLTGSYKKSVKLYFIELVYLLVRLLLLQELYQLEYQLQ